MSVIDRYTVEDLREMANLVHDAGLGARGQGLYALLLGLALEKGGRKGGNCVALMYEVIANHREKYGAPPDELVMTEITARELEHECRRDAQLPPRHDAKAERMYFCGIPIRLLSDG